MSRDMKPRRTPAKKKAGGGTLLGLFIGLVVGVLIAAGVVWYINKMPTPFTNKSQPNPASAGKQQAAAPVLLPGKPGDPVPQPSVDKGVDKSADNAGEKPADKNAEKGGEKGSEKGGEKSGDKPRFDFYKILPGNTEAIPEPKPAESSKGEKAGKEGAVKEPLFLQAGSFQKAGDADNLKATLALAGMEATVQQVMVQDKVWYRVRLGPYGKIDDVNRARAELAKQGVEAAVVKNQD